MKVIVTSEAKASISSIDVSLDRRPPVIREREREKKKNSARSKNLDCIEVRILIGSHTLCVSSRCVICSEVEQNVQR